MKQGFVNNLLRFSVPTLASAIAAVTVIPVVSNFLPANEYAKTNLFCDYGFLLSLIFLAGTDAAYIRFFHEVHEGKPRRVLFTRAFAVGTLSMSVVAAIVVPLFGDEVSFHLFGSDSRRPLILLAVYTLALAVYRLTSSSARLNSDAKRYNSLQVSYVLINRLFYCIPMLLFGTYDSAILFLTMAMLALSGISLITDARPIFCISPDKKNDIACKAMIAFGIPSVLTSVLLNLMSATNKTILANSGSFTEAGVYAMALTIANVFAFLPAAFGTYWSVYVYQNYKTKNYQIRCMHDFALLLSVALVIVIFLSQDLFYAVVGEGYRTSQQYFMLVMMWPVQAFLSETTSYGINLSNKTYLSFASSLAAWVVCSIACSILAPFFGGMGAAVAFAAGSIVAFVARSLLAQPYYRTISSYKRFAAAGVAIVAVCIANTVLWQCFFARVMVSTFVVAGVLFFFRSQLPMLFQMTQSAVGKS